MRQYSTFVNSAGHSGTNLVKRVLELAGCSYVGMATNASVGTVPMGQRADELPDFDPTQHVLTGVHWPGWIEAKKVERRFARANAPGCYGASHLFYTPAARDMFERLDMRMVLIVREARDWSYSAARKVAEQWQSFDRPADTPLEQHLAECVFGYRAAGRIGRIPITDRYRMIGEWQRNPFVLVVRFEDLVGARGGGSDLKMNETIRTILSHIGQPLGDAEISTIAEQLYGGTTTFRKGRIGTWADYRALLTQPAYEHAFEAANAIFGY